MASRDMPMTDQQKACFTALNQENLAFLMDRYNRVNRWVIADMIRRLVYHYADKTALIFGERTLTMDRQPAPPGF